MMKFGIPIFLFFLLLSSCTKNTEEKKNSTTKNLKDSKKNTVIIPKKLTEESRAIDKANPPVVLDIIVARKKVRPLKYSQLGKKMHQIVLKHPFDSTFLNRANVVLSSHHIVVATEKGIALFDLQGKFVEMICTNGKKYEKTKKGYMTVSPDIMKNYAGALGMPFVIDDSIYYRFVDMPHKKSFLLSYTPQSNILREENVGTIDTARQFHKGKIITDIPTKITIRDLVGSTSSTLPIAGKYFAVSENKIASYKDSDFLTICTVKGDTICRFKDFDPVNIQGTYRNPESNIMYNLEEKFYVRQCYNDTIYCLTAPNKLTPKYILDFHEKNINSAKEGLSITVDLKENFLVKDIKETKDYLFVFYTQNYDCPNTARDKTLKYNLYVFDKNMRQGSHAYIDEEPYIATLPPNSPIPIAWPQAPQKGLMNDIDENPECWDIRQTGGKTWILLKGNIFNRTRKSQSKYAVSDVVLTVFE